MEQFLKLKNQDKRDSFFVTAEQKKMSVLILEKDFWVCFLLDILFHQSIYKEHFVFKGGTSLSKGYQIIERFSEDIDLVLDGELLGYEENTPWEERSNRKQELFNEKANQSAALWINETLRLELENLVLKKCLTLVLQLIQMMHKHCCFITLLYFKKVVRVFKKSSA